MARILIISDAWHPQVNGVVRTIEATVAELPKLGHVAEVIGPDRFHSVAMPFYREIRLALLPRRRLARLIAEFAPDVVHLATEGPLGWAARGICLKRSIRFTTAYHTRFPEYLAKRLPIPLKLSHAVLGRFHNKAGATLVATESMLRLLQENGIRSLRLWTRGVDLEAFQAGENTPTAYRRPVMLYAGRLAVEKNIEAFLKLDLPGTKLVVGDGPQAAALRNRYRDCVFTGNLSGPELARAYAQSDVLVFPSKTDTFGLVMIEALACGTPVAAYPVPGPQDVLSVQDPAQPVGVLDEDLAAAITRVLALNIPPERCRDFVTRHYTWQVATRQFADAVLG